MNRSTRRGRLLDGLAFGAVVLSGLIVRLIVAGRAPVFLEGDSQGYLLPGWELVEGAGFSPELRRAPLYSMFIAAVFKPFGEDLQGIALVQHVVGLATAGLAYLLGRRLFGRIAGLLAGLAIALSGPQLIYERYLMTEALFGLILTAAGLAMVAALGADRESERRGDRETLSSETSVSRSLYPPAAAGLFIGLAALTRPVAQALLPLFVVALLLVLPRWRPALKAVGLALVGYALLVVPWTVRNLAAHETFAAAGGLGRSLIARTVKYDTLFDWKWLSETYGNRDDLDARARMLLYRKRANIPEGRSVRPYQDALMKELGLTQGQTERMMREIGLEAIARRPLDYVRGSLLFTAQLFLGRDEPLQTHWKQRANKDWEEQWDDRLDFLVAPLTPDMVQGQSLASWLIDIYQPARMSWLLGLLAVLGCWLAWGEPARRPALLLAAVALELLTLSAFLDGPVPRYRYPLDPLIAVLAAGGVVGSCQTVRALVGRAGLNHLGAHGMRPTR